MCGITSTPPNKEIRKSALGSTNSVEWEHSEKTEGVVLKLRKEGYLVCAIEQVSNSVMLNNFKSTEKPLVVVFGNEVNGVQQSVVDLCDVCIEIPQIGTKHSLNISVSVGVVLWDLFYKVNQ